MFRKAAITSISSLFFMHAGLSCEAQESQWRPSKQWGLEIQMTDKELSNAGYTLASGLVILTSPRGQKYRYAFKSGGHGQHGNDSMLPGLQEDFLPNIEGVNAYYKVDWQSINYNSAIIRREMRGIETDKGSWLRIAVPENQFTERGRRLMEEGSGSFGFHPDGCNSGYEDRFETGCDDGTKGCIGVAQSVQAAFFKQIFSIPRSQRPQYLVVREASTTPLLDPLINIAKNPFNAPIEGWDNRERTAFIDPIEEKYNEAPQVVSIENDLNNRQLMRLAQ